MTLAQSALLATLAAVSLVPLWPDEIEAPEPIIRYTLTKEELDAHRVAEESRARLQRALCGDHFSASQVLRVQEEVSAPYAAHTISPLCSK